MRARVRRLLVLLLSVELIALPFFIDGEVLNCPRGEVKISSEREAIISAIAERKYEVDSRCPR